MRVPVILAILFGFFYLPIINQPRIPDILLFKILSVIFLVIGIIIIFLMGIELIRKAKFTPHLISPKGNWYRVNAEKKIKEYVNESDIPGDAIEGRVSIKNISINKSEKRFRATFALYQISKNGISEKTYEGDTAQIRWFLREKFPAWSLFLSGIFALILLLLVFLLLGIFPPILLRDFYSLIFLNFFQEF